MRAILAFACAAVLAAGDPLPVDQPIIPLELGAAPSPSAIAEALGVPVVMLGEDGRVAARMLTGAALFTPTTARELLAAAARRAGLRLSWVRDGAVAVVHPAEDPAVIAAVEAGLSDPVPAVRVQAAWRAGFVRDARAVSGLLAARADAEAEVRSQARHSLQRIGCAEAAAIGGPAALPVLQAVLREAWTLAPPSRRGTDELGVMAQRATPPPPPPRTLPLADGNERPYVYWPLRGDAIDQAWTERLAALLLDPKPKDVRQAIADAIRRHPAIPPRTRAVAWRAVTVGLWSVVRSEFAEDTGLRPGRHATMPPSACALHLAIGQWEDALEALWAATPDPALSRAVAEDDRAAAVQLLRPLFAAWGARDAGTEGHGLAMLQLLGGAEAVELLEPWLADASRRSMAQAVLRSIDDGPALARLAAPPPEPLPPDLLAMLRDEPAFADLGDPDESLDWDARRRLAAVLARCPAAAVRAAFAALQQPGEPFALRKAALELEGELPIDLRMEVLERAMLDNHVQLRSIAAVAYLGLAGLPHAERVLALADDRHSAVRMWSVSMSRSLIGELAERLVLRAASDPHAKVREAVIERLRELAPQRLHAGLLARVQDAGDAGRAGVAALLIARAVAVGPPLSTEEVVALHAATAASPDAEVRLAGADALRWSAWNDENPAPALQRALADADALVVGRATASALLADAERGAPLADRLFAAAEIRALLGFVAAPGLARADHDRAQRAATVLLDALMAGGDRKLGAQTLALMEEGDIPVEDTQLDAFRTWLRQREIPRPPPAAAPPGDF